MYINGQTRSPPLGIPLMPGCETKIISNMGEEEGNF